MYYKCHENPYSCGHPCPPSCSPVPLPPGTCPSPITIGQTVTGQPGTVAAVYNSGTPYRPVLNFTIPQGGTGPAGPAGVQGPAGPEGPQGAPGAAGSQGIQGPMGSQGIQGPAGPTGAEGPQGPVGATGPTGPTGAEGPQGPAGPAGEIPPVSALYAVNVPAQTPSSSSSALIFNSNQLEQGTGLTHTPGTGVFSIFQPGIYLVSYSVTGTDITEGTNEDDKKTIGIELSANGTAVPGSLTSASVSASGTVSLASSVLIRVPDSVSLSLISLEEGSTFTNAGFSIHRLGDTM